MADFRCFQINEYKTFEYVIIKNEVDEVILLLGMYILLTCHECESFVKFEEKFLDIVDY